MINSLSSNYHLMLVYSLQMLWVCIRTLTSNTGSTWWPSILTFWGVTDYSHSSFQLLLWLRTQNCYEIQHLHVWRYSLSPTHRDCYGHIRSSCVCQPLSWLAWDQHDSPKISSWTWKLNHPHRFIDIFLGVRLGPTDEQRQEFKNTFNNFGLLKWEFEEPSHEVTYLDLIITLKTVEFLSRPIKY